MAPNFHLGLEAKLQPPCPPLQSLSLSIPLPYLMFLQSSLHFLKLRVFIFHLFIAHFSFSHEMQELGPSWSLHYPQFLQQCLTHQNECCMNGYIQALGILRFPGPQRNCWPPRGSYIGGWAVWPRRWAALTQGPRRTGCPGRDL